MKRITIIWNDGTEELVEIHHICTWRVYDGTLQIETGRNSWRYIPLTSIREYRINR